MPNSLRKQLVMRLLWPLLLLFVTGAIASYFLALHFANLAYDRGLYDSVRSLAQQVRLVSGAVKLDLPRAAIEMFEWDDMDITYYAATSRKQGLIFGQSAFPAPPIEVTRDLQPNYYDTNIAGNPVRAVAVRLPPGEGDDEITIQVGETLTKRNTMTRQILLALILLQGVLIAIAVLLIRYGVTGGVQPLLVLARQIKGRRPGDLRPVGETAPDEVQPLTQALNALFLQLEQAHSAQQRFIAQAAHQLRTPLAALQVQAERALREPNPEAHKEALAHVLKAVSRLTHLSHQLLTFARAEPEAGAAQRLVALDLVVLTREVAMDWVPTALENQVDLGYSGLDKDVALKGEPLLLRELLGNLIDNALQYGRKGGQVTVGVTQEPAITLYVEDDGPGIPPEASESVLQAFVRLPGSAGSGCGLGLAIVCEIADLHGAKVLISAGSNGLGTRVSVSFP